MDVSCSEDARQLFRASTRVTVGKGDRAEFWEAAWLQGRAPRDIAPLLYKFAWRKHQTVKDDLNNNKWTRMSSVAEMAELISLWSLLENVVINGQDDKIAWKWTSNGNYTAKVLNQPIRHNSWALVVVANMASYAISSSLILVIHDNMIIVTNLIVLACLCRHF
jgi:hypothetical protein